MGFRAGGAGGASVGRVNMDGLLNFGGRAGVVLWLCSEVPIPDVKEVSGLDLDVTPLITEEPLMPEIICFFNALIVKTCILQD